MVETMNSFVCWILVGLFYLFCCCQKEDLNDFFTHTIKDLFGVPGIHLFFHLFTNTTFSIISSIRRFFSKYYNSHDSYWYFTRWSQPKLYLLVNNTNLVLTLLILFYSLVINCSFVLDKFSNTLFNIIFFSGETHHCF